MPYLHIRLSEEVTPALADRVATTMTQITADQLGKRPEVTAVVVEQVPAPFWFIGARSLDATGRRSFHLDITVTDGTNTKQQKAAFVREAFAAMTGMLGELDEASYVVIHDLAADAWGYGGKTQEYRFIMTQGERDTK